MGPESDTSVDTSDDITVVPDDPAVTRTNERSGHRSAPDHDPAVSCTGFEPEADTWKLDRQFKPKLMTRWLSPRELVNAGGKGAIASVFESFSDRRETFAARDNVVLIRNDLMDESSSEQDRALLPTCEHGHRAVAEDFWFDFVADTGDGFSPTFSIAEMIGYHKGLRPDIDRDGNDLDDNALGTDGVLHPGELMIMGGDQVYPLATDTEYRNRTIGPFELARREHNPGLSLLAIPGNHDWYDGLTSFLSRFCTQQWIGAWKTRQSRSYWAAQIHEDWWVWGIDIALENTPIDHHQLEYFRDAAQRLEKGQKVILVTSKPGWHQPRLAPLSRRSPNETAHTDDYDELAFFMRTTVEAWSYANPGVPEQERPRVAMILSGDKHFYHRYDNVDAPPHKRIPHVTAGGGGAYLSLPLRQPTEVTVPREPRHEEDQLTLSRIDNGYDTMWPTTNQARRLGLRAPQKILTRSWSFCALLAALYTLLAWSLRATWSPDMDTTSVWSSIKEVVSSTWQTPAFGVVYIIMALALMLQTRAPQPWRAITGFLHAFWHVVMIGVTFALAEAFTGSDGPGEPAWWGALVLAIMAMFWVGWGFWMNQNYKTIPWEAKIGSAGLLILAFLFSPIAFGADALSFYLVSFGVGSILSGLAFAMHLLISHTLVADNANEISVAIREIGFKHFIRMKIDKDGALHAWVLGLEKVPHQQLEFVNNVPQTHARMVARHEDANRYNLRLVDRFTVQG